MQGAAKVGFLVIVFVLLLYGGYALLGRALVRPKTATYYASFIDAAGTTPGTVVNMAGVKIGTVSQVSLIDAGHARVTLECDAKVRIPAGSLAKIGGSLIGFGASPISIVPPSEASGGDLPPGATIPGVKASPMEDFLPEAKDTLKELTATLKAARKVIGNDQLQTKLVKLMDDSATTMKKFGTLADQSQGLLNRTNGLLAQNQPAMATAMKNASLAMSDIRKSTQLLTKLIESGKYQDESLALLKQLNQTAAKANDLVANLGTFVNDPELQSNIKSTMTNVNKMSDSGTRIAANTEEISKNGITLSQKAIELADKANAIADEAKAALEKISGFFTKGGVKPVLPKVESHLDLMRQTDPAHWRTDLYGRIRLGEGFVDAGLYDAFESNKVILQYGDTLGSSLDFRYGIYASKPGVGVDFRVAPRVSLRSDLFDINNPKLDFRTQFDFGNGFVGWLGMERIFQRNAFMVGIGIKK